MTESPGNGGVELNLHNISQSTVPESHNMEAINQSPGGQSRLKITDHSLVPDSSCDINLENNQQVCYLNFLFSSYIWIVNTEKIDNKRYDIYLIATKPPFNKN